MDHYLNWRLKIRRKEGSWPKTINRKKGFLAKASNFPILLISATRNETGLTSVSKCDGRYSLWLPLLVWKRIVSVQTAYHMRQNHRVSKRCFCWKEAVCWKNFSQKLSEDPSCRLKSVPNSPPFQMKAMATDIWKSQGKWLCNQVQSTWRPTK